MITNSFQKELDPFDAKKNGNNYGIVSPEKMYQLTQTAKFGLSKSKSQAKDYSQVNQSQLIEHRPLLSYGQKRFTKQNGITNPQLEHLNSNSDLNTFRKIRYQERNDSQIT